jgi:nucleotide-binding universal stress UspA family protein
MAYADIVVDASPSSAVRQTLEAAADFAKAYGGRLSIAAFAWPRTSMLSETLLGNAGATALQASAFEETLETTRAIHDEVAARRQLTTDWCSGVSDPNVILKDHLLTADLAILGAPDDGQFASVEPTGLSAGAGAPVLRIGSLRPRMPFQHALVAWKDSRESRRSVHEALPLLRRTERVIVLGVGDEVSSERLAQVAEHLVRHQVAATHLHLSKSAAGVCTQILQHAEAEGCDLLVSGAYSRPQYSERIFGGVTRELLEPLPTSWFLAH